MICDKLRVPEKYIGLVIGKKGKTINKIQIKFKVFLVFLEDFCYFYSPNNKEDIINAKNYVFRIYEKKIREEEMCPICLEKIDITKNFSITECGHRFHTSCLLESTKINRNCPLCREELLPSKERDIELILRKTLRQVRKSNYIFYLSQYTSDIYSYQIIMEEFMKEPIRFALKEMIKES